MYLHQEADFLEFLEFLKECYFIQNWFQSNSVRPNSQKGDSAERVQENEFKSTIILRQNDVFSRFGG